MKKDWFFLSRRKLVRLILYYILLFVVGIVLCLIALLAESYVGTVQMTISLIAIVGSFGTSLLGCTIFYLRKLYKASINNEMSVPQNPDELVREIGVFYYYLLRPLFAVAFSLLIHIALKSSVNIITVKETILDEGFIYLSMFLAFFAGFAAGDLLTYIEKIGKDLITRSIKH